MHDIEGFKTSVEEVAADVEETARELESEVEPEDVTESLQTHDKTDAGLLRMHEEKRWFAEMKSTEDAVKIAEVTTKDQNIA